MEQARPPGLGPAPLLQAALQQCPLYGSHCVSPKWETGAEALCTPGHVPTQTWGLTGGVRQGPCSRTGASPVVWVTAHHVGFLGLV